MTQFSFHKLLNLNIQQSSRRFQWDGSEDDKIVSRDLVETVRLSGPRTVGGQDGRTPSESVVGVRVEIRSRDEP